MQNTEQTRLDCGLQDVEKETCRLLEYSPSSKKIVIHVLQWRTKPIP